MNLAQAIIFGLKNYVFNGKSPTLSQAIFEDLLLILSHTSLSFFNLAFLFIFFPARQKETALHFFLQREAEKNGQRNLICRLAQNSVS